MLKRYCAFFIVALMVSALGCASTEPASKQESSGTYMDDSWITTKVKTAIFNQPSLKVTQINVGTHKGVVQLSGFVDSAASIDKAAAIARSVKGVTSVRNDLLLK